MKKSILISLGIAAALGVSTSIYAYTAEQPLEINVDESSILESMQADSESNIIENTSTTNELSAPFIPVTVNIENNSNDDLFIPLDLADRTMSQVNSITANNPIKRLVLATATDWGTDIEKRVIYALESGSEVEFYQSNISHSPEASIQYFKNLSLYDPNEVSVIDINGFQAVIEDGSPRKTVHLVTNDHVFIVVSIYEDVTLDYLIELAKEINISDAEISTTTNTPESLV